MSDKNTPITDAAQYHPFDNQGGDHVDWVVDAEVARELERKLATMSELYAKEGHKNMVLLESLPPSSTASPLPADQFARTLKVNSIIEAAWARDSNRLALALMSEPATAAEIAGSTEIPEIKMTLSATASATALMVLNIVNMLLEDVAEKPERLQRAQEIAKRDITPLLAPAPCGDEELFDTLHRQLTEVRATVDEIETRFGKSGDDHA